ncbi:MAG: carboxypeptidase regulatory-like domain-containing protein [Bacteroidales bacterium]|jgi:fibronectin type 3 domain-containing protein|nr:carboxypeptidase regulatory-like domain-containing protein [Bacteroidales bacterium]
MKKKFLFLFLVAFCTTQAYSQKYAASQTFTNGGSVSTKVAYLENVNSSTQSEIRAENLEIIWHKPETYAVGEQAYYSKLIDKALVNWGLNDKRVAQYANTITPIWEFPTTGGFPNAFSNKNGSLHIVIDNTELYALSPENGDVIWQKTFEQGISYAAPYPDGTGFYCSVGSYPDPFTVYSFLLTSQTPVWSLPADNTVVGISVAEDHSQVIVCLSQPAQKAMIVNPTDGAVVQEVYYYNNSPSQAPAFSANGEYLAFADFSGKGTLYKRVNGKYEMQWQASIQNAGSTSTWGCGIAISADGSTIVFGTLGFIPSGYMGSVYVFNNYSNQPLWSYHNCGDEVSYISMTDDGSLIACATWGPLDHSTADLYIFRKESSEPLCTLNTLGSLYYVEIAPDGSKGVTCGKASHAREMGWGGNAYLFKPFPSTYGHISGNVNLIGTEDNSFVLLTLVDMDKYFAFSNVEGDFNIKYIPAGTYKLTASKQGYYSKTIENIVISGENTTNVTIELQPAGEPVQYLFATQGAFPTVNLNWKKYDGAHTGFNIYRKLHEQAPFTEILATVGANETHFVDNTALPTLNYYYAVTAIINEELEGSFSNTALGYTLTSFITKEIDIYSSTIVPTIDGVISPGEWDDAFVFDVSDFLGSDGTFQPVGSVIMYIKMCGSMIPENNFLYVAVENKNDTQLSAGDRTAFYIDDNNNGTFEEPGNDSEGNYWINYGPAGVYSLQYRPIYNTGGVGTVVDLTPNIAASDATGYVVAEFTLPVGQGDYNIIPGPENKSKAYIYVRDGSATGPQDGQWPYDNPETFVPIGYGTMNFFVNNKVPPPPTNLRYTPYYFDSPEFVAIAWDLPKINDLDHFNVIITNVDSKTVETFETDGNQLIYNVEDLTTYQIIVITVNKAGQESEPSEKLEINTNFIGIDKVDKTVFKIYPNPAYQILKIEAEIVENTPIEIFNISGNKIATFMMTDKTDSINIAHLTPGIYFIKVGSGVQKFVKY